MSQDKADEVHDGGWVFLDLAEALADDGDHVTLDLAACSITAQNFRGVLKAFWNVCSHRAIQMRDGGTGDARRGHGVLRCPYHGWSYDAAGVPRGIPDNEWLYGLDEAGRTALALRPAGLWQRGTFLFVHPDAAAVLPAVPGPPLPTLYDRDCVRREGRLVVCPPASPLVPPGFAIDRMGDWVLWRRSIVKGDALALAAGLYHPHSRSWEAAPDRLRAAFGAILG